MSLLRRTICRVLLLATLAGGPWGWPGGAIPACAQGPSPSSPGGYVLLDNGNVLPGRAVIDGAFVRIEQSDQASIRLPEAQVLHWAETLEQLYAYRTQHRPQHSLSARFADLRWAIQQGLLDIAEAELRTLQRLAPSDRRGVAMAALLKSARRRQASSEPAGASEIDQQEGVARPERFFEKATPPGNDMLPSPRFAGDMSPSHGDDAHEPIATLRRDLLLSYTRKIQPLLINRCGQAGCHGGASSAIWQLEHFGSGQRLPANHTRQNLTRLLRWINDEHPEASPLLVRAGEAHGDASAAPLTLGDESLRETLEAWIVAMSQRQSQWAAAAATPAMVATAPAADTAAAEASSASAASPSAGSNRPTRLPPVSDPFDPAAFNRIYHPR